MLKTPMGAGFFIFFQRVKATSGAKAGDAIKSLSEETKRISDDDEELMLILQLAVTRHLI